MMKNSHDDMKKLNTALYIRLSREDGDKEESNSVAHQRDILKQHVKKTSYLQIYDTYIDDGFSGTNFRRPGFERMLADIEEGVVKCVLVKDLSRFARDYVMAGLYIERYFPEKEVRFISLGENYDSETATDGANDILLPIQNLFNEFNARDTSRKVQRVMRSMQQDGKCVSAFTPYGYLKNPNNKHQLIKDDYASIVIGRIYKLFLSGMGMQTIAKTLNHDSILCPSEYKKSLGSNYKNAHRLTETSYWTESTVKTILKNEVYIGTLVQGKTRRSINRKPKRVPKEEWIRIPNAHEPIISADIFEKAQALLKRNARGTKKFDGHWSVFAGVIKCGDCGRSLCKTSWNDKITYKCGTYKRIGKQYCTPHAIKEEELIDLLRKDLNVIIQQISNLPQLVEQETTADTTKDLDKRMQRIQADLEKCKRKKSESYDDYKEGLLTKTEFLEYGQKCDKQREQLEGQLNLFNNEKTKTKDIKNNPWICKLLELKQVSVIDRETVLDMVHEIQVFENDTIKIIYNFNDELDYLLSAE